MVDVLYAAHVVAFVLAAVGCLGAAVRGRRLQTGDTRRTLSVFLVLSAGWAASHVGFLLVDMRAAKELFYVIGLVIGFATVFAWLAFCSAYSGRSLHRDRSMWGVAAGIYAPVFVLKVTNPIHGYYFTTSWAPDPFYHLAVQHGMLHWLAMGLAYALAVVGFFMLIEVFREVGQDVKPLVLLMVLFGAPIGLDVYAVTTRNLVELTYEPLGVAVFAIGLTGAYHARFRAVQLASERSEPVLVLSEDGLIRDYNSRAAAAFPSLSASIGQPLDDVLPEVAAAVDDAPVMLSVGDGSAANYYQVTTTPPRVSGLGEVVSLSDVTERERHRRELQRQNERLERFASVVSHDLRNPLTVAQGRLDLAREEFDSDSLETVDRSLDRMEALIDDLLTLARQGRDIDETATVNLVDAAEDAWAHVDAEAATLSVAGELSFEADPDRFQQLLENLYRNAIEHGGAEVTVTVGTTGDGFFVADDGPGIPAEERDEVFESGYTTSESGTGFGLAIVSEIVRAHGWQITVTESEAGGARFEITGVTA